MSHLCLQAIRKSYGTTVAVHALDLDIQAGELVSLLGPSGCGKTTILRMIAGFETPTMGRILLGTDDITEQPPSQRRMGMVFQSYSLFPHMTAAQNIAFGLKIQQTPPAIQREKVQEMLELVGLKDKGQRYPHQLSGGQQQRIALARALAISPRVLLLDEPLSALDAQVRLQLRHEIRRIQQQLGMTTLFVTHDQEEALSISDRVVVMSEGRIDQMGTPEEIYLSPQTAFTASFIGSMNQIPGLWERQKVVVADSFELEANHSRIIRTQWAEFADGTPVIVLIRPENMQILSADAPAVPGSNMLTGLIAGRIFLGAISRLSILVGDYYLNADLPTGSLQSWHPGQIIQLSFPPEHCRVIPQGATSIHQRVLAE